MAEENKTAPKDAQPQDVKKSEELSPEELGEVSGGLIRRSGDPCEGGEITGTRIHS